MNEQRSAEELTILNDIKTLGFTEYEARIYVALLGKSPATAYEISNRSGVPRPNAYSALKALAARRAVMPVSANPIRYIPQPADRLFKSIAAKTSELCDTVTDRLSSLSVDPGEHYVWDLSGTDEVHGKVSEMINNAKTAIWWKAEPETLRRHQAEMRRAAVERGVRILIILYGQNPAEFRYNDLCEVYEHEGTGFPMGFADNLFTLTVDHREMLTANFDETLVAAHTQNRAIVKMAISLLRHDYYMAEIFRVLQPEIDAEFGPHLRDLRQHSYSPEQFAQFEDRQGEYANKKKERVTG